MIMHSSDDQYVFKRPVAGLTFRWYPLGSVLGFEIAFFACSRQYRRRTCKASDSSTRNLTGSSQQVTPPNPPLKNHTKCICNNRLLKISFFFKKEPSSTFLLDRHHLGQ